MLPGNVRQEVTTAFLTDAFTSIYFTRCFFTSPILGPIVFVAKHNLNSIYAYKIQENSVIVKVHVII